MKLIPFTSQPVKDLNHNMRRTRKTEIYPSIGQES